MKKIYFIFSLFFISFSHFVSAEFNIHSTLILHYQPAEWSYDGHIIRKNPQYSFEKCKEKWQKKLDYAWKQIIRDIAQELKINKNEFSHLLFKKEIQELYYSFKLKPQTTAQNQSHPTIKFISENLKKYTLATVSVVLDSEISYATSVQGIGFSHILECNSTVFNQDDITRTDKKILFDLYLSITASQINHNTDFYHTVACYFVYNNNQLSADLQKRFNQFSHLINSLEAVLQSENPLETAALFYDAVDTELMLENKELQFWKDVIKDLERCCHPQDLLNYQARMMRPFIDAESFYPFE